MYVCLIVIYYSIVLFLYYNFFLIPSDGKKKNIILLNRYIKNMSYLLIVKQFVFIIKYKLLEILYYFVFLSIPT